MYIIFMIFVVDITTLFFGGKQSPIIPLDPPLLKKPRPLLTCVCAISFQRAFAATIYGDLLLSCSHPRPDNGLEWGLFCELVCNLFMARILLADDDVVVGVGVGLALAHVCVRVHISPLRG